MKQFRIGNGYDIHQLAEGRRCVLGGVEIPSDRGLLGHSDADCLTHAVCDALLGAAGLPDIGHHFPNTDERYRAIDSQVLLQKSAALIRKQGFEIENIDTTLIAENPRVNPYRDRMKAVLAASAGVAEDRIGVKATTNEGIDDIGRQRAIAAYAVCLLSRE